MMTKYYKSAHEYPGDRLAAMKHRAHVAEAALGAERRKVAELESRLREHIDKQINPPIILTGLGRGQKRHAEVVARAETHNQYKHLFGRLYWRKKAPE